MSCHNNATGDHYITDAQRSDLEGIFQSVLSEHESQCETANSENCPSGGVQISSAGQPVVISETSTEQSYTARARESEKRSRANTREKWSKLRLLVIAP